MISADGSIGPELSRRIGAARAEFDTLARIWSHTSLSATKKIRIYEACVLSKLLYCLHTAWLKTHELARFDAFHAKCLRKILGIPMSYISRIPNITVLHTAASQKLSSVLLQRQLTLLAQVARKGDDDPLRSIVLKPSSVELRDLPAKRKRGRPRLTWASEVYKHAVKVCQTSHFPINDIRRNDPLSAQAWKRAAQHYCSNL